MIILKSNDKFLKLNIFLFCFIRFTTVAFDFLLVDKSVNNSFNNAAMPLFLFCAFKPDCRSVFIPSLLPNNFIISNFFVSLDDKILSKDDVDIFIIFYYSFLSTSNTSICVAFNAG